MKRRKHTETGSDDYEIGRGRPPKATQWKPGQSGNPTGRPKGSKNLLTLFEQALKQNIRIEERGRSRKISAREGIVRRLINLALKGDLKATEYVLGKDAEIARRHPAPIERRSGNKSAEELLSVYQRLIQKP